jgi:hypothetical protein
MAPRRGTMFCIWAVVRRVKTIAFEVLSISRIDAGSIAFGLLPIFNWADAKLALISRRPKSPNFFKIMVDKIWVYYQIIHKISVKASE